MPLSFETVINFINSMKKPALIKESQLNGLPHSDKLTVPILRKTLRDHTKLTYDKHGSFVPNHLTSHIPHSSHTPNTIPNTTTVNTICNSIVTLEAAIISLTHEVTNQQKCIEAILLNSNPTKSTKPLPQPDNLMHIDKRMESIEDSVSKLKEHVASLTDISTTIKSNSTNTLQIAQETLNYTKSKSHHTPDTIPRPPVLPPPLPLPPPSILQAPLPPVFAPPPQPPIIYTDIPPPPSQHNSPHILPARVPSSASQPPAHKVSVPKKPPPRNSHSTSTNQKKYKALVICDSQLKYFNGDNFLSTFDTKTLPIYTYEEFINQGYRRALKAPGIDCYILQLGVNDLKKCRTDNPNIFNRVCKMAKESITKLLTSSQRAKVCISLPTPTPANIQLDKYISMFNDDVSSWISETRNSGQGDYRQRLYTIDNRNFKRLGTGDNKACPYQDDMLHLNNYGLKKLSVNMKFGVYRAFGWKYNYTPKPDAINS